MLATQQFLFRFPTSIYICLLSRRADSMDSFDTFLPFIPNPYQLLFLVGPLHSIQYQQKWLMQTFAGWPTLCLCVGVYRRTLLIWPYFCSSSSMFCLSWMVCEMGGKWLYSSCFVGCCLDLFKIVYSILSCSHLTFSPSGTTIQKYWHEYSLEEFPFYQRYQVSIWLLACQ